MGLANINGLVNFSKKCTLYRTNEDGTAAPTIRKLVQSVMKYETLDEENIWLAKITRDSGGVTGYFSCVLPEINTYTKEWTQFPPAQIYWFLICKGYKIEDVVRMIQGSFFIDEQMKVSKSRWSKSLRIAVVDNGDGMDSTNVAKKSRAYDTNLGLSNKEKRQQIARTDRDTISFGEAMTGEI